MKPRPASPPSNAAKRHDDFEWPPQADDLSVYELGADPWQALHGAASDAFAERRQAPQPKAPDEPRQDVQRLAGVVTALALVAAASGLVLYRAMSRPAAVTRVHHRLPPAPTATPAAPPRLTIVATYPVEPDVARSADGPAALTVPAAVTTALPAGMMNLPAADAPSVAALSTATADASIRTLLRRYEEAYERGDVRTAAMLWPSLDQGALSRAFARLDRQDVQFDRCDIDAGDARGSAVCVGTVRYVPSVGRAVEQEDRITWTFALARSGDEWHIDGLTAQ